MVFILAVSSPARAALTSAQLSEDEAAFQNLSELYRSAADRAAVIEAFSKFVRKYSDSARAPDAQFMMGEAYMSKGLELLRQENLSKMSSDARVMAGVNPLAIEELENAIDSYRRVIKDYGKSGLQASAQQRIGEALYNMGDWERAINPAVTKPTSMTVVMEDD